MRVRSVGMMVVAGLLVAASVVSGCGGRQRPPATGSCREGRQWVPPAQDAHGTWQDGYCRSTSTT
jgi:hypothetical protein